MRSTLVLLLLATATVALPRAARGATRFDCSGDVTFERALEVRNLVRDFNDADDLWRDDVDHSMPLAHGSPWRAGAGGYAAFQTIPAVPCERDTFVKQDLSSFVDRYELAFFDTEHKIEVLAWRLDTFDTLATSVPSRTGTPFVVGSRAVTRSMTGGTVRTKYAEAVYGYENGRGHYVRLGVPILGLAGDVLFPRHTSPDYRIATADFFEKGPFGFSAAGEDRSSDHLLWIEPRVTVAARENESHAGGYVSVAEAILPGGFQAATAGLEFDGRGLTPVEAPVIQARFRVYAEATAFELARASHPGSERLPHSIVGGFATGLSLSLGGSIASFGWDVRGGVNRPALLRDIPMAHGQGDVSMTGWMRITPPVPHRRAKAPAIDAP